MPHADICLFVHVFIKKNLITLAIIKKKKLVLRKTFIP